MEIKLLRFRKGVVHEYVFAKICYLCKEHFKIKMLKTNNIVKLEIVVNIQGKIEVLHIAYII